ncbi:hypothetical protein [Paracoccus homiensis]|uniref:hypothetical protein n=1 Tax=Paracoccus homiensis TaxID=364199 RepID=UPI001113A9DE|nr:hypothetical protein [Paracoccus homiensis]
MAKTPPSLLSDIEVFLSDTQMSASYFGKKSAGNSELVPRLRGGGRVWPETETKIRSFMLSHRGSIRKGGHGNANATRQDSGKVTLRKRGASA